MPVLRVFMFVNRMRQGNERQRNKFVTRRRDAGAPRTYGVMEAALPGRILGRQDLYYYELR